MFLFLFKIAFVEDVDVIDDTLDKLFLFDFDAVIEIEELDDKFGLVSHPHK